MTIALIVGIATIMSNSSLDYKNGMKMLYEEDEHNAIQYTIGVVAEYGIFGAYAKNTITTSPNTIIDYRPYRGEFETDFYINLYNIKAGWEHKCEHPILSRTLDRTVNRYGGYDRIYISTKIVLKGD